MVVVWPDPPPTIVPPQSLPVAGPIIRYAGAAEHAVWDNVWDWVSGSAKKIAGLEQAGITALAAQVLTIVEPYVGQLLKAESGFLNDIADFASMGIDVAIDYADAGLTRLLRDVLGIEDWVSGIQTLLGLVADVAIPALLGEIIRIGGSIDGLIAGAAAGIVAWAIDNIYDPLSTDIVRTAGEIYDHIQDVATWMGAEAAALVNAETLARIAAVGALALTVAGIAQWIKECGDPICNMFGPKTGLGKLFKALSLAEGSILLAELAALDEDGINNLLRGLVAVSNGVIDNFGEIFTGGETIGGAIGRAAG